MRPDTPTTETDPADVLDQQREARPEAEPTGTGGPSATVEADPADVADQERDVPQDDEDY